MNEDVNTQRTIDALVESARRYESGEIDERGLAGSIIDETVRHAVRHVVSQALRRHFAEAVEARRAALID